MEKNTLEFECMGIKDGGKFPVENTGRGEGYFTRIYHKKLISICQNFYDYP